MDRVPRRPEVLALELWPEVLDDAEVDVVLREDPFDQRRGFNTLTIQKISRASAEQRAGRAGRTAPGVCLRLWSERDHAGRQDSQAPELHRLDLSETLLTLKAAGVGDVRDMAWLDPPKPEAVARAEALLMDLGALSRAGSEIRGKILWRRRQNDTLSFRARAITGESHFNIARLAHRLRGGRQCLFEQFVGGFFGLAHRRDLARRVEFAKRDKHAN